MIEGLVIGKFMPFHNGHIELINFALANCDILNIAVCSVSSEPITGMERYVWVRDYYKNNSKVKVKWITEDLPNSSKSSRTISKIWSNYLKKEFPNVDIIFASEKYAEYVAEYMNIDYKIFDVNRIKIPISATLIRENCFQYWDYIPDIVKPYFIKKICVYGSESCGKTTLVKKLANQFNTSYVPEMARYVGEFCNIDWNKCTESMFIAFAKSHRDMIITMSMLANKILFIDSDNITTQIYADKYIGLKTKRINEYDTINYDLYLLMKPDVPFIQDGTRKYENQRWEMHNKFKDELIKRNIKFYEIDGDWDERFSKCVNLSNLLIDKNYTI